VTSVTYKTHPALPILELAVFHQSPDVAASVRFYTEYLRLWPAMNDAGLRAYSFPLVPNEYLPSDTTGKTGITVMYLPNATADSGGSAKMNATLAPLLDWVATNPQDANVSMTFTEFPSLLATMEAGADVGIASAGNAGGSRLVSADVFEKNATDLAELLYGDEELFSTLHLSEFWRDDPQVLFFF
jgi:hypothetical protein